MAATQEASGTQTATIGTEHTLATITTAKPFQLLVDISALAAGEYVEIKVKRKVLSAGTLGISFSGIYSWLDAAVNPVVMCDPILSTSSFVATIKQLSGTGRAFPWAVETP